MQKKIIALAVAGLVSGGAFAQSNVTVYGQMNMAYESDTGHTTAGTKNLNQMRNMDSRLGFRGEEALGNGLKAVFTAEFGVQADSNGSYAPNNAQGSSGLGAQARQTFVGVSGNFGTVTMGRQYTPFFETAALLDPFGASTTNVGSVASLHPVAAVARGNNAFKYAGNFNGVIVGAMYGLGENASAANPDPRLTSLQLAYAQGPFVVGITTINMKDTSAATVSNGANTVGVWSANTISSTTGAASATTIGTTTKATAFGGSYDLGVAKLSVMDDRVKIENGAGTAADLDIWMFGATVPFGAHTFRAAYNRFNDKLATNLDANGISLGYGYALSKRTNLVANYVSISNKNGATQFVLGSSAGTGGYTKALQLGLAHSF